MGTIELDEPSKLLVQHLVSDVFECQHLLLQQRTSQYVRRTFVRTFFSFLEGFGRVLRASLRQSGRISELPPEWRFVLSDERIEIEQTGKPKLGDARYPFANLFAATLRSWAMLSGWSDSRIIDDIFGDNGWKRFREALDVRHSLTHPKVGKGIEVDDDSLKCVMDGFEWFGKITLTLLEFSLAEFDKLTE